MPRPLYGAIEAGGTKFLCAAGYGPNEVLEEVRFPTSSPSATLGSVVSFFERIEREVGPLGSFGIAAFGPLDLQPRSRTFGHLLATPKSGWAGTDLLAPLKERFARPIAIDTDVNAAALAEAHFGAGFGTRSLAYVTVGTGIGGGAVIDGRTLRGLLHPEMGHIHVRRDPRDEGFVGVCPIHRDCLEGLASGPAIAVRWGATVDEWPEGHPGLEIIGDYLGQLAALIALLLSCERIVFGGGVMTTGRLMPHVRTAACRYLNGYLPLESVAFDEYICAPGLAERAGITGAFVLATEAARRLSIE